MKKSNKTILGIIIIITIILTIYNIAFGTSTDETEPEEEKTNIKITKKWDDDNNRDGVRPTEIMVILCADGNAVQTATFGGTGNEWSYEFTDLPIKNEDGINIEYTLEEKAIDGYKPTFENIYLEE